MNHLLSDNTVQTLRRYLEDHLQDSYDLREAQNLIVELFYEYKGWSRSEILLRKSERISESELLKFHFALKRLKNGEPLQYIVGHTWFAGRKFITNPTVLIPRPETEELVQLILLENQLTSPKILDIGTGSGCIAVSLALNMANAKVTAIDISSSAISTAEENAKQLGAAVEFHVMNILEEIPVSRFDIIVSNPPYITESESASMRNQVVNHEPHQALFVRNDAPLIFYERIADIGSALLNENGLVFCEIHEDQKDSLVKMLQMKGDIKYSFHKDLQEKFRILQFSYIRPKL